MNEIEAKFIVLMALSHMAAFVFGGIVAAMFPRQAETLRAWTADEEPRK